MHHPRRAAAKAEAGEEDEAGKPRGRGRGKGRGRGRGKGRGRLVSKLVPVAFYAAGCYANSTCCRKAAADPDMKEKKDKDEKPASSKPSKRKAEPKIPDLIEQLDSDVDLSDKMEEEEKEEEEEQPQPIMKRPAGKHKAKPKAAATKEISEPAEKKTKSKRTPEEQAVQQSLPELPDFYVL